MACTDDLAFLVLPSRKVVDSGRIRRYSNTGPDSILVYSTYGVERVLAVPTEYADERAWNRNMKPSLDTQGNLVVASLDGLVPGAIIDPRTGCYAVLRNREFQLHREFLGVYRDSALVFHRDYDEGMADGKRVVTLYAEARKVSLNLTSSSKWPILSRDADFGSRPPRRRSRTTRQCPHSLCWSATGWKGTGRDSLRQCPDEVS